MGFDTEMITVKNGKKMMDALLTYDSFASHTTMCEVVKDTLSLETKFIGNLQVNTYNGIKEEIGYQASANIVGLEQTVDFIISSCSQKIPAYQYDVPVEWFEKYNLSDPPTSTSGLNYITIGKDQAALFPSMLQVVNGVCISKSNITGRYILSGRAISSNDDCQISANKTCVTMMCDDEKIQGCQIQEETVEIMNHNTCYDNNDKNFLKEITSDSITVPPVKRCIKCVGCKSCKKIHLPDQARQMAQAQIVKDSLTFDVETGMYTASYPYNKFLSQLEVNQSPCKRMMISLEAKLRKENLVQSFNDNVNDFIQRGVIKWVDELPGIENLQRSYIPLTFTLKMIQKPLQN